MAFRCPGCGMSVWGDLDFCPRCGHRLTVVCPACGRSWRFYQSYRYCPGCGQEVAVGQPGRASGGRGKGAPCGG